MSLALMSHTSENEGRIRIASVNSILNMELRMLDSEFLQTTGLNINEEELSADDTDELKRAIEEVAAETRKKRGKHSSRL